jgi:hypothetical protein
MLRSAWIRKLIHRWKIKKNGPLLFGLHVRVKLKLLDYCFKEVVDYNYRIRQKLYKIKVEL